MNILDPNERKAGVKMVIDQMVDETYRAFGTRDDFLDVLKYMTVYTTIKLMDSAVAAAYKDSIKVLDDISRKNKEIIDKINELRTDKGV